MLRSLFNKVAGLKTRNFTEETPAQVFYCEFCAILQKTIFTENLQMTAHADSSFSNKILSTDHTFFIFFLHFLPFLIDNHNYQSLFRNCKEMKIFLLLITIIYPKINMNVFKTICLGNNLPMRIR